MNQSNDSAWIKRAKRITRWLLVEGNERYMIDQLPRLRDKKRKKN